MEDGFDFVRDARAAPVAAMRPVEIGSEREGRTARAFVCATVASTWFRAIAPGQPPRATRPFYVVRCDERSGVIRAVWSWSPRVEGVSFTGDRTEITVGDERHVHYRTPEHWQVELNVGSAHSGIELTGWRSRAEPGANRPPGPRVPTKPPITVRRAATQPVVWELGEPHYRRSEETWTEAACPSARVSVTANSDELIVDVFVATLAPVFAPADAVNPYDNEHPDVNGDGVQLYVRTPADGGAWMIVPEVGRREARVRPLEGWGTLQLRRAVWRPSADGYELRAHIALGASSASGDYPIAIDVLINETAPGRERRRGQLVLSGAEGEFVYLRGDRHDPARLVPLVIVD